jgi:glutamine phosphoribosylpyrophosphate amidotransferase
MCGIGGIVKLEGDAIDPNLLISLLNKLDGSGPKAVGIILVGKEGGVLTIKTTKGWSEWGKEEKESLKNRAGAAKAVLVHTRAPTTGPNTLENTHPFEDYETGLWLAHNGGIFNHDSIFQLHDYKGPVECDSMAVLLEFLTLIKDSGTVQHIADLEAIMSGWWNCWAYLAKTNDIVLFTNMEGFRAAQKDGHFIFANLSYAFEGEQLPSVVKINLGQGTDKPTFTYYPLAPVKTEVEEAFKKLIVAEDDRHYHLKIPEDAQKRFQGWKLADNGILIVRKYQCDKVKKNRILGIIRGVG